MKRSLLLLMLSCSAFYLNACAGGGGSTTPPPGGGGNPPPAAATHLSVTTSATPVAGTPFHVTVTALDASDKVVSTFSGTVHFTSSDAHAVLPADSKLTNGTETFSVTFKSSGSQTITVADMAGVLTAGKSSSITVSPGAATQLSVTAQASSIAGTAFNVTVSALDASNNVVSTYSGTVHFTSSDIRAALPADSKLTNGTGTFSVFFKTSGSQTLTIADAAGVLTAGNLSSISVSPGAATQFFVSAPASSIAGTPFNFTVTALDASNNTVTGYSGTVHFTSSDAQALLPANSALTSGTASLSATMNTAGTQTITATDTVKAKITGISNSVNVSALPATHFSVSAPASASAGTAFNFTVTALDASNKTATGYSGTVHFTSTDAKAALPANLTLTSGAGTFTAILKTVGSQTITATDTVTATITGISNSINALPGSPQITSGTPPNGTVGVLYDGRSVSCQMGDPGCNCSFINGRWFCGRFVSGFPLTATGGATPYSWSWAAAQGSSVPPGLCIGPVRPCSFLFHTCTFPTICGQPTAPGTYNVVVTVTDSESPAVQASANYTILINPAPPPAISVSIATPTPTTVAIGSTPPQFTATVMNDVTNSGVAWTLMQNGVACPTGCGTLSPAKTLTGAPTTYTPPAVVPAFPIVTVTATSVADGTKSASITFTVTTASGAACGAGSGSESLLKGQYAFLLQGFDSNNNMAVVGSVTADGTGKITGGEEDVHRTGPEETDVSINATGSSYAVGSDHRGCLVLANANGETTYFRFALGSINSSNIATTGHIIEFDDTTGAGTRAAGTIRLQDATSFVASQFKGNYTFGVAGGFGDRFAMAGTFASDGISAVTSTNFDADAAGTITSNVSSTPGGSYTCCTTNGRGTLQISSAGLTIDFWMYMINSSDAFLVSTDISIASGEAIGIPSSTTFTQASLNGASVIHKTAQSSSGPIVDIATASADAAMGTITVTDNVNNAGTFTTTINALNYLVAANGRVTVAGGSTPPVLYLYGPNQGFLVGTDPNVEFGIIEPQAAGPFSDASLSGAYMFGTENHSANTITLESGVVTPDGTGNAAGTSDQSSSAGLAQNQSISPAYSVSSSGTGTFGSGTTAILISGNKLVFINNTSATPTITVVEK